MILDETKEYYYRVEKNYGYDETQSTETEIAEGEDDDE